MTSVSRYSKRHLSSLAYSRRSSFLSYCSNLDTPLVIQYTQYSQQWARNTTPPTDLRLFILYKENLNEILLHSSHARVVLGGHSCRRLIMEYLFRRYGTYMSVSLQRCNIYIVSARHKCIYPQVLFTFTFCSPAVVQQTS